MNYSVIMQKKMGINKDLLGRHIIFIFNALILHENDQRQIDQVLIKNNSVIDVIDNYFIVGGLK